MRNSYRRPIILSLAGAGLVLRPTVASAQEASGGGFLQDNMAAIGAAVLVVVVLLVISRRRRARPVESGGAVGAPASNGEDLAATTFSAMGLMSNAEGPLSGDYFVIKQTGLTIGRDPESCDVVYEDSKVSRQHARLEYTNDGLMLKSLSDTNQTFLNDEAISEAGVKAGDRIRIEAVTFKVLPHGSE